MKTLIINSPKYGKHDVYYDDEDHDLVSKYPWHIYSYNGMFYVTSTTYYKVPGKSRKSKRSITLHRLIMGFPKDRDVDHADHNGLNNQKSNLRIATDSQNSWNKLKPKNNTSGFKGVSYVTRLKKYMAYITFNNKREHLGLFIDPVDAAKEYNLKAVEYFGEFACINKLTKAQLSKKPSKRMFGVTPLYNPTGYRGVGMRSNGKFYAGINFNYKYIHLGTFINKEDAAISYNEAAKKYFGKSAYLNDIKNEK